MTKPTGEPAGASAECEPRDAYGRDCTARSCQPEPLCLPFKAIPGNARSHAGAATSGINLNEIYSREIDDNSAVTYRIAGVVMPTAAN